MKKRIERLEAKRGAKDERTVIAFVPHEWDEMDQRSEVARLARLQGIQEPYRTMLIDTSEDAPRIGFVGDLDSLLERVARESARIGME